MATMVIETEVLKITIIRLLTAKNIVTYRASVIKMCLSVVYYILVIGQIKSQEFLTIDKNYLVLQLIIENKAVDIIHLNYLITQRNQMQSTYL